MQLELDEFNDNIIFWTLRFTFSFLFSFLSNSLSAGLNIVVNNMNRLVSVLLTWRVNPIINLTVVGEDGAWLLNYWIMTQPKKAEPSEWTNFLESPVNSTMEGRYKSNGFAKDPIVLECVVAFASNWHNFL